MQEDHQTLLDRWDTAKQSLKNCGCGSAVVMLYEPGCSRVCCIAEDETKLALPDWCPEELAKEWNEE